MKKLLSIIIAGIMLIVVSGGVYAEEKPTLRVAINAEFLPFEYYDENGQLTGFDIELMNYIGETQGYEIQYEDMAFEVLLAVVKEGKADCAISAISITEERQAFVDFSSPYISCQVTYPDGDSTKEMIDHYGIVIAKDRDDDLYAQIEEGIQKAKDAGVIDELAKKYNLEQAADAAEDEYAYTAPSDAVEGDLAETKNITVSNQGVDGGITVAVNSQDIDFQIKPFIDENNRTQMPVREFAEFLGCSVYWSAEDRQVSIMVGEGGDSYHFIIGENKYRKNGDYYDMDTAAQIVDNRTFIPLRYIAEMMGYTVEYVAPKESVILFCDKDGNIILEAADIISCTQEYEKLSEYGEKEHYLLLKFTDEAQEKFREATKRISRYSNGENYIEILIRGEAISRPQVVEEIDAPEILIVGNFTGEEVRDFADTINAALNNR